MAVNMRVIAYELNDFQPQLFINSRINEEIKSFLLIEEFPEEVLNEVLYVFKSSSLDSLLKINSNMNINLLYVCDNQIPRKLTSYVMLNLISIKSANLDTISQRLHNIINTCSDEGYIPRKLLEAACIGGLQYIADTAYSLLGNPIIIYDLCFRILAFSKNVKPENEGYNKISQDPQTIENTMVNFFRINALDTIRKKHYPYFFTNPFSTIINAPIIINEMLIGFVVVNEAYVQWHQNDLQLTNEICKIISLEIKNSNLYKNSQGQQNEQFLIDMLENPMENERFTDARLKAIKLELNNIMYIVVIKLLHPSNSTLVLNSVIKEFKNILTHTISTIYKDNIVLLVHNKNKSFLDSEHKNLENYLISCNMVAGISRCFHDSTKINMHYKQAVDALRIGIFLKKPGQIYLFQELFIYRLFELSNTTELLDVIHPDISKLINYDLKNKTELMKTLYYYVFNMKALLKTKNNLQIHRNTLVYRIRKIQEIMNIDLNDSETFFQIYLTFKGLEVFYHKTNREISFL